MRCGRFKQTLLDFKETPHPIRHEDRQIQQVTVSFDVVHGETDPQIGMIFLVVLGKTLPADAPVGLHFNRHNRKTVGHQKIHFGLVALQSPVVGHVEALRQQGSQDKILGHSTLEFRKQLRGTNENSSAFKVYLLDIGLLRKLSKLHAEIFVSATHLFTEFKGAVDENFVQTSLLAQIRW